MLTLLKELIWIAIDNRNKLSWKPTQSEWLSLYDESIKHAISGVLIGAVEKLPEDQRPLPPLLYTWIGTTVQIESRNTQLNQRCTEVQTMFAEAGFETCILKGQGNALIYPNPLRRQSGDIDIWVNGKAKDILSFLATKCDIQKQVIGYHHVEFPIFNDVEVEVHWRPSWKSSPLHNQRMQKWFKEQADAQFNHLDERSGMHVPTWEFNVIYLLQHMYLHIFQEGLGLRQVMDYYYLLHSAEDKLIIENGKLRSTLKYLGLWKFAGAAMYVMQEVFALDEKFMIAPVDKRRGTFLLEEIMRSGNFGRYDERNRELSQKKGISRSLARLKRQYRYLRDYPVEVLCAPFQIYHVIWRKMKLWKWE